MAGVVLIATGVFWAGRESTGGSLSVFWEHWWCPVPLVAIVVGVAGVVASRWRAPAA